MQDLPSSHARRISPLDVNSLWLQRVEWFEAIDSTNDYVKRTLLAEGQACLPWLVVADRQTMGRGRNGNRWWSPDGCLMFSIAMSVDPANRERITQLPLIVGMSIAGTLRSYCSSHQDVRVKWPNDVMVGGRKIAGILIESFPTQFDQVWVIGVGLNVRVPLDEADVAMKTNAPSLHREVDIDNPDVLTPRAVLTQLLEDLQTWLDAWSHTHDYLVCRWPDFCFLKDKQIQVRTTDAMIRGLCLGIDDSAGLRVIDETGYPRTILSGSIESWT